MLPLLIQKAVQIHKLKRSFRNLQHSLLLQLSHWGAADWATSLWQSSLSGSKEPVDTLSPFNEMPYRFLHTLVDSLYPHHDAVASGVQAYRW